MAKPPVVLVIVHTNVRVEPALVVAVVGLAVIVYDCNVSPFYQE